jgi:uncharacterized protein YacL (UPF0231 family)
MINIRFYQDQEGYFKADAEPQYQLLSQYFESEIQGIAAICEELLAAIKEIESGDRPKIEGIGNGLGLKLTAETATIWSEFTETQLTLELSLADFKQALESCCKFCDRE